MEIIVKINGEYQIVKIDLHEYIKFQSKNDNEFMIFPIKESEYKDIKKQIEKGCFKQNNDEKIKYMIKYNPEKNNIVVDNYNIEVDDNDNYLIGSYIVDADGFHFVDRENEKNKKFEGIKIYTTARYEDVIVSYFHKFVDINFKKISEKIFNAGEELTKEEMDFYIKCITNESYINNKNKTNKVKAKSKIISK